MHSLITPLVAFATLTVIPAVSAHGWVSGVTVNGKTYPGVDIDWYLKGKTPSVTWYAKNYGQHNPLYSEDISSNNMACHNDATPGSEVVPVKPGDTLTLHWVTPEGGPWRTSHEGPMLDYMASCGSDCRHATAGSLNFFKIGEAGMYKSPHTPGGDGVFGLWATDTLRNNNNQWKVTIPQGLSGPHVLRTEAFALMGAGNLGHAQLYPQCVNLDIQGSGAGVDPCNSGAECRKGADLYTKTDPGIFISIHKAISKYQIPGPALWKGAPKNPNQVPTHSSGTVKPNDVYNPDHKNAPPSKGAASPSKHAPSSSKGGESPSKHTSSVKGASPSMHTSSYRESSPSKPGSSSKQKAPKPKTSASKMSEQKGYDETTPKQKTTPKDSYSYKTHQKAPRHPHQRPNTY